MSRKIMASLCTLLIMCSGMAMDLPACNYHLCNAIEANAESMSTEEFLQSADSSKKYAKTSEYSLKSQLVRPLNSDVQARLISTLYGGSGGTISCDFDGYVNTKGRHEGIDFTKNAGAAVHALTNGTVVRVTNTNSSSSLSTLAIYDDENDKTVIYLHTAHISVSVGDTVTQGQVIATESNCGASSAHTHVEVRSGRKTAAAVSVNDYTLDNPNPYPYWTAVFNSNHEPVGCVDAVVSAGTGQVFINGWAYDPDDQGATLNIHLYMDGGPGEGVGITGEIVANQERPDINEVFSVVGNHGFQYTAHLPEDVTGLHTFYLYAIDTTGGTNPCIGSGSCEVEANSIPIGVIDSLTAPKAGYIHIEGWAFDNNATDNNLSIHVYMNGPAGKGICLTDKIIANAERPDVNEVYGITGKHGISTDLELPAGTCGDKEFYVYAIDTDGGHNPCIGSGTCKTNLMEFLLILDPQGGTISNADFSGKTTSTVTSATKLQYYGGNWWSAKGYVPTRSGYTFNGFYTSTNGGSKVYGADGLCTNEGVYFKNNKYIHKGNLKVFAQWTANEYTISFDANGGSVKTTSAKIKTDSTYALETPTRSGYTFMGWYTSKNGGTKITSDTKYTAAANQILYAQWKQNIGDCNNDGKATIADAVLFEKWLCTIPDTKLYNWQNVDMNKDGKLNVIDLTLLKRMLNSKK